MRFLRLLPLAVLAFTAACTDDTGAVTNVKHPPLAYVRYVNAVPDYSALDFKFIDDVEYSPSYPNSAFRSIGVYQGARTGARLVRVFPNSPNVDTTQIVVASATLNLTAGTYYTILHRGYRNVANGTISDLVLINDGPRPAQVANKFHLAVTNAIQSAVNQDVFVTATTATPLAGAPAFANIVSGTRATYAPFDTLPFAANSAATGTTVRLSAAAGTAGVPGTLLVDPIGGYRLAGTAFTAFLFPRSTAATPAPQTAAFQVPAVAIVVDRQPPSTRTP